MRGVSDGSNPNYANTSSTGFLVDDMSMSYGGAQPDLHLYDIQSIQVLNGPQGTTYGAGAMSGAIIYTTNKPDLKAFSAGIDFDGGQIQSAQQNWNYEGFLNAPLIDGVLGLRISAFSDSHGGFINNQFTTRTWVNGSVSDNAQWARNNYNRENVEGGRVALKAQFSAGWDALLTYGFQRQHTNGAWDEDPTLAPRTVSRFGPESNLFETNMIDFHVDGDVGIGDLVFASTYWNQERRQWDEYSQYEQNHRRRPVQHPVHYVLRHGAGGRHYAHHRPAIPLNFMAIAFLQLQTRRCSLHSYNINPQRWSNELRLSSKPGGRLHWLAGLYWERTIDRNYKEQHHTTPGAADGYVQAFRHELQYYAQHAVARCPARGAVHGYTEIPDSL